MPALIRTGLRDPLSRKTGLCYAVGAERISAGIGDVPQRDELYIYFLKRQIVDHGKRLVMLAYMNGGAWRLSVYAIPRALSAPVREKLSNEGFARCREWLTRPRKPLWFDGSHQWQALFDERKGVLAYEEHTSSGVD